MGLVDTPLSDDGTEGTRTNCAPLFRKNISIGAVVVNNNGGNNNINIV